MDVIAGPADGRRMHRVLTGSDPLDDALGGGLPSGSTILVEGPQGMGSTEFSLSLLRRVASEKGRKAVFATALRTPARARAEAAALFRDKNAGGIEFIALRPAHAQLECIEAISGLNAGDALVVESTAALARAESGRDVIELVQMLANAAHEVGAIVIHLHAPGTLPTAVEASIAECADGVFTFCWRDGGPMRRRSLIVSKLRGLAPMLDGEQVPVFEASLHSGIGFAVSRVKSVI